MRSIFAVTVSFVFIVLFSGCAAPLRVDLDYHQPPSASSFNPDNALVYFYRINEFFLSARGIYITADGERVGALNNGTYFIYETTPGEHIFAAENGLGADDARTINLKPGDRYFIRGFYKSGFWDAVPTINIMNRLEGENAVTQLKHATLK